MKRIDRSSSHCTVATTTAITVCATAVVFFLTIHARVVKSYAINVPRIYHQRYTKEYISAPLVLNMRDNIDNSPSDVTNDILTSSLTLNISMDKYTTLRSLVNHWISVSDNIRNFPPVAVETFIAQVLRRKDSDMASAKQAVELIENIDETLISAKSNNLFCQLCFQMSLPLTALHFVDRVNGMASLVPKASSEMKGALFDTATLLILIQGFTAFRMFPLVKNAYDLRLLLNRGDLWNSSSHDLEELKVSNAYLAALLKFSLIKEAESMYAEMSKQGVMDWFTLNAMLKHYHSKNDIDKCLAVWSDRGKISSIASSVHRDNDTKSVIKSNGDDSVVMMIDADHVDVDRRTRKIVSDGNFNNHLTAGDGDTSVFGDQVKSINAAFLEGRRIAYSQIVRCLASQPAHRQSSDGESYLQQALTLTSEFPHPAVGSHLFYEMGVHQTGHEDAIEIMLQLISSFLAVEQDSLGASAVGDDVDTDGVFGDFLGTDKTELDAGIVLTSPGLLGFMDASLSSLLSGYLAAGRPDLVIAAYVLSYDRLNPFFSLTHENINCASSGENRLNPALKAADAGDIVRELLQSTVSSTVSTVDHLNALTPLTAARPFDTLGSAKTFNVMAAAVKSLLLPPTQRSASDKSTKSSTMNKKGVQLSPPLLTGVFPSSKALWSFLRTVTNSRMLRLRDDGHRAGVPPALDAASIVTVMDAANAAHDFEFASTLWYTVTGPGSVEIPPTDRLVHSYLRSFQHSSRRALLRDLIDEVTGVKFTGSVQPSLLHDPRTHDEVTNALLRCWDFDTALKCACLLAGCGPHGTHGTLGPRTRGVRGPSTSVSVTGLMNLLIQFDRYWRDYNTEGSFAPTQTGQDDRVRSSFNGEESITVLESNSRQQERQRQQPQKKLIQEQTQHLPNSLRDQQESVINKVESWVVVGPRNAQARSMQVEAGLLCKLLTAVTSKHYHQTPDTDLRTSSAAGAAAGGGAPSSGGARRVVGGGRHHSPVSESLTAGWAGLAAVAIARGDWATAKLVLAEYEAAIRRGPPPHTSSTPFSLSPPPPPPPPPPPTGFSSPEYVSGHSSPMPSPLPSSRIASEVARALAVALYSALDSSLPLFTSKGVHSLQSLDPAYSCFGATFMLDQLPPKYRFNFSDRRVSNSLSDTIDFLEYVQQQGQSQTDEHNQNNNQENIQVNINDKQQSHRPYSGKGSRDATRSVADQTQWRCPVPVSLLQALFVDATANNKYKQAARVIRILQRARLVLDCDVSAALAVGDYIVPTLSSPVNTATEPLSMSTITSTITSVNSTATTSAETYYSMKTVQVSRVEEVLNEATRQQPPPHRLLPVTQQEKLADVQTVRVALARAWAAQLVGSSVTKLTKRVTGKVRQVAVNSMSKDRTLSTNI